MSGHDSSQSKLQLINKSGDMCRRSFELCKIEAPCPVKCYNRSTEIHQLQKLEKRAARIATNNSYDAPSRPLPERLGWKTVEELIEIESETIVFKSLHGLAPPYLCNLFTRKLEYSRSLRNTKTDLKLTVKKAANGQKCFSFRGAKLWNGLSAELKQASSPDIFKQKI